jgi:hypothetical protein
VGIRGRISLAGTALLGLYVCVQAAAQGNCAVRFDPATRTARIQILDQTPPYHTALQDGWTVVAAEAFQQKTLMESDRPELPCLEYWISVPADTVLQSLDVQSPRQETPLSAPLRPAAKSSPFVPGQLPPPRVRHPETYDSGREFPARWGDTRLVRMGSTTVLVVRVYAFKYAGAPPRLVLYPQPKITVTLTAAGWNPDPQPRNVVDAELKKNLVNPEAAFFGIPAGR